MELIANMSANTDSFQWIGYNETVSYVESAAIYEYHIRCTISMCESVEGKTRRALEASIQNETYDEVLSHCLGRVLNGVSGSFASTSKCLAYIRHSIDIIYSYGVDGWTNGVSHSTVYLGIQKW